MKKIIALAIPAIIANLANVGMGCADTIVAGRASGLDMSGVGLGNSIFVPIQLFACGILMIFGPIISNLRGKGTPGRIGHFMNNGIWLVAFLSVVVILAMWGLKGLLPLITDDRSMQAIASGYMSVIMWGVPANLAFVALRSLNEGSNMTRPAMIVGLLGLLVNIPANIIFVFGYFGMPALGGVGCAVATSIVFWVQFAVMGLLVYHHPKHRAYRRQLVALRMPALDTLKRILKLGLPLGFSLLCEVLWFCAATLLLASLGYIAVGAHQVAISVSGVVFMIPLSIGMSVSIRVAYHSGRNNANGIRAAIRCSYWMIALFIVINTLTLVLFRMPIVSLYNDELAIVGLASSLLIFAAIFQMPDGLQTVTIGVLRGFRDTLSVMYITFISYWVIGFPVCFILAKTDWVVPAMGAAGVWIGFIVGLAVAVVCLIPRMRAVMRKEMERIGSTGA